MTGAVDTPCVGASGALYGIAVYAALRSPRTTFHLYGIIPIVLGWLVGIMVFIALYDTMLMFRESISGGVAHGGHLGGALGGLLAFKLFNTQLLIADHRPWFGGVGERLKEARQQREAQSAAEKQKTLDELLDKVHREGMSALTSSERKFLERTSKDLKDR